MQQNPTIFFQSSLPRAGSTLFQNLIGQNPDFYVTPTSGVLELVFAARHNYTESPEFKAQDAVLMQEGVRGFCREGFLGYYDAITDKPYVLDIENLGSSLLPKATKEVETLEELVGDEMAKKLRDLAMIKEGV